MSKSKMYPTLDCPQNLNDEVTEVISTEDHAWQVQSDINFYP